MPPEFPLSATGLKGTIKLVNEFERIPTSVKGTETCAPQLVRVFRGDGLTPPPPAQPADSNLADPVPGPTLRARVGDLVQLRFANEVDSSRFDQSIDVDACMQVGQGGGTYPGAASDVAPNCLHASSTANIHFHGTHTSPNGTADNVYLQIRPLPRDNQGKLTTTAAEAMVGVDQFFDDCAAQLKDPLNTWPARWSDMPASWVAKQTELLQAYQAKNPSQPLWDLDKALIPIGWPQYYIGTAPYCFVLPHKPENQAVNEGPLRMGQAPGTHWYHAHKHGSTAINVENGMTGAFIIEGQYDDFLNAFYGSYGLENNKAWNTRSQPVLVLNQLGTVPNLLNGGLGPAGPAGVDFLVNGRLRPVVHMQPGEVQLWRIVNTSGRNAAYFTAPQGFQWRQLAQDGVQFANPNYQDSLDKPFYMAPGNRVDLLVQAPATPGTANVLIQQVMARAQVKPTAVTPGSVLMSIVVAGDPVKQNGQPVAQMPFLSRAPDQPKFLADITDDELKASDYPTKRLVFDSKSSGHAMQHTINGIQFSNGEAEVKVFLGNTEEWTIVNTTSKLAGPGFIDHPFHIHINPFQITEVFDPNENLTDPTTGQLETQLDTSGKPVAVPRYVTDKSQLTNPANPFRARQCFLDPKDQSTWSVAGACGPQAPRSNLVWWDVFAIPSARVVGTVNIPGYFKMRSRFVDYPGYYVLHCHILVHEDRGMMFSVEVTKAPPMMMSHH
jgi:FtsP/CotA-like multicopper oxidase with cupredoxin domain